MATATQNSTSQNSELENPKKTLTLTAPNLSDLSEKSNNNSDEFAADIEGVGNNDKESHVSKDDMGTVDSTTTTAVVSPTGSGAADDIEKKVRRAERFGVPVQLSEQEKRNSRAERFGMGAGSEASKTSEDQKRKARAERKKRQPLEGSLASNPRSNKSSDELRGRSRVRSGVLEHKFMTEQETKKKARLARFGSDTKTDTLEEEKRKARALRFAQPPSNAAQHINGKEDVGSNTAIAGNTVEGA